MKFDLIIDTWGSEPIMMSGEKVSVLIMHLGIYIDEYDSFSTFWEIRVFGFRGEYGRKVEA